MKRRALALALLGASLTALLACNSLLGIDPPNPRSSEDCVLNSDCEQRGYVCLFRVCSPPCLGDQDCSEGSRCLATEGGTACVNAAQASCDESDECPSGNVCSGGTCRIDCSEDPGACLRDQVCSGSGICRGTDPSHDPQPGPAELGGPCESTGELACAEFAAATRLACEGAVWVEHEPCADGTLCNNATERRGECDEIPEECQGRQPNESFCDGTTRKTCGPDRVTVDSAACASNQHCTYATGVACAACLPNEFSCNGNTLQKCNDASTAFADEKTCTDAPCSASAGDCTEFFCGEGQKRCAGDTLEVCTADRSGFVFDKQCEEGLCDSGAFECDVCIASTVRCEDEAHIAVCDENGQSESVEPCGVGTCSGSPGSALCSCPTPPSDCSSTGTVCRSGQVATCGLNPNGCLITTNLATCPNPQVCSGSFPNANCTCPQVPECDAAGEMNGSYCSGNTRITCTAGPQSCQQVTSISCANVGTEQCVGSHPNAKCEKVYGDATPSGVTLNFPGKVLWLVQVTLSEPMQLRRLGFLGSSTGNVIMTLYEPRAAAPGIPGSVITWTAESSVSTGRNEYTTVHNPTLSAGTYWVGIIGESTVHFQHSGSPAPTAYWDRSAGTWPPTLGDWYPAYPSETTQGQVFSQNKGKFYVVGVP